MKIVRIILCFILISGGYGCATLSLNRDHPVSLSESWAIATYRLLDELNHQHCFCLGGNERSSPQAARAILVDWWGITDRKGTLEILDWLLREGHRMKFDGLRRQIVKMSPSEFDHELSLIHGDQKQIDKMRLVRLEGEKLGEKGILAWDLARYIWVTSRAFAAGYLTDEEAWEKIMPVAYRLQQNFESWSELGKNYLIGRKFWGKGGQGTDEKMAKIWIELLRPTNKNSPWISLPWNTPLEFK